MRVPQVRIFGPAITRTSTIRASGSYSPERCADTPDPVRRGGGSGKPQFFPSPLHIITPRRRTMRTVKPMKEVAAFPRSISRKPARFASSSSNDLINTQFLFILKTLQIIFQLTPAGFQIPPSRPGNPSSLTLLQLHPRRRIRRNGITPGAHCRVAIPVRGHHIQLADCARSQQLLCLGANHRTNALAAHLQDAPCSPRRLNHLRPVRIQMDHRLLAISNLIALPLQKSPCADGNGVF